MQIKLHWTVHSGVLQGSALGSLLELCRSSRLSVIHCCFQVSLSATLIRCLRVCACLCGGVFTLWIEEEWSNSSIYWAHVVCSSNLLYKARENPRGFQVNITISNCPFVFGQCCGHFFFFLLFPHPYIHLSKYLLPAKSVIHLLSHEERTYANTQIGVTVCASDLLNVCYQIKVGTVSCDGLWEVVGRPSEMETNFAFPVCVPPICCETVRARVWNGTAAGDENLS